MVILKENTDFGEVLQLCKDDTELQAALEPAKIKLLKTQDYRLLLISNIQDTSTKKYKVKYQCKGVILDELEHTFLSIPNKPHSYYEHIHKNTFDNLYNENNYDIILAHDGTTVTLYNFNGMLCMGTGKSVDVTNYHWSGSKTFAQMFYESASSNPLFIEDTGLHLTDAGNLRWNVPTNYSVTVGFRHHNIHKNLEDPQSMWLIRCVDLNTRNDIDNLSLLKNLATNKKVNIDMSLKDILSKCNRDINLDQNENFYGFICIYKGDELIPIEFERVFIPGTLYKLLQHFFYSVPHSATEKLDHNNRYIYSLVRNIITNNHNNLNLLYRINSHFKIVISNINTFITDIVTYTINRYGDSDYNRNPLYNKFADDIIKQVNNDENEDLTLEIIAKLISDYVRYPTNTLTLSNLYIKKMNPS